MKYKKTLTDNTIFDGISDYELSKATGISASHLSLLRRGKRVASEEMYEKMLFGKTMLLQNKEFPKFADDSNEEAVLDNLLNI